MPREHQFPFELRHLVYFHEVARNLHFNRSANALGVTQPALSRQIRQLEEALGLQLFERNSRKVILTPEGRLLAEKCNQLFSQMHDMVRQLNELATGGEGVVRIMYSSLAMASIVPEVLSSFSRSHPKVRVELAEAGTETQLQCIARGEVDCGFCHPEVLPPGLRSKALAEESMGIVLPKSHRLARKECLDPEELKNEQFILFPRSENPLLYDRMLLFWREQGVEPRVRQQLISRVNRIALAAAAKGISYACRSEAPLLPPEAVFRPFKLAEFKIKTYAVWRAGKLTSMVRRFIETLALLDVQPHAGLRSKDLML